MNAALETHGLAKRFGGIVATNDVSFRLERGARQALIDLTARSKTTFINLLTGVVAALGQGACLGGGTSPGSAGGAYGGLVRPFPISRCSPT
jgi:branched-chain amino acid transport system ATP-binding protein